MAINTFELCIAQQPFGAPKGVRTPVPAHLRKPNFESDSIKRAKTKKKRNSPYLYGEKVQLFSRMTEKRAFHKNNEVYSSYPTANNIYKANSDEFNALKKCKQKAKKSVLTLPNVPAPIPKTCTVSDINDSDCYSTKVIKKFNAQKKFLNYSNRKPSIKSKGFEFYDRDARHLDNSSTDLSFKNGDVNSFKFGPISRHDEEAGIQDVWSVLRNINKFQFRPTPRIADEDSLTSKKNKNFTKKYRNRKGRRLIETCRTEEVAYVANFEIQSKTSASRSSSFDRITVISKDDLQTAKFPKSIADSQSPRRIPYKSNRKMNDKNVLKNNVRTGNVKEIQGAVMNNHSAVANFKPANIKDNQLLFVNNRIGFPNHRPTNIRDNQDAFMNNHNALLKRLCNNTVKSAAADVKPCQSPSSTIDSSNCLRTDNESNCTLKPNFIHPYEIKDMLKGDLTKGLLNHAKKTLNNNKIIETSSNEKLTTGMTQMVLNNNSALNKGLLKPKPRLVTTMPSAATMPKFTASDIKRRIAQIKFPLVILGKDQLSSSLEVFDYDPPQFQGLNKHIWPFMLEWKKRNHCIKNFLPRTAEGHQANSFLKKTINETSLDKKERKQSIDFRAKKFDCKRAQPDILTPPSQKKLKPMRQFKDKMLKLLYKNNFPAASTLNTATEIQMQPVTNNASTEMSVIKEEDCRRLGSNKTFTIVEEKKELFPKKVAFVEKISKEAANEFVSLDKPKTLGPLNMKVTGAKQPWAKAKWASDFIDNVMRKIRNGSYYAVEDQKSLTTCIAKDTVADVSTSQDTKEVSIQTSKDLEVANKKDFEQNYSQTLTTMTVDDIYDPLVNIPGFDNAPPRLEMKTLNSSLIQVKNCLTNVTVQFDVSVPDKRPTYLIEKSISSSSFIPLSVTHSNTKLYKCSTTIVNAVLPAEICTLIPQLMKDVFESTNYFVSSNISPHTNTELSECDSDAFGSVKSCHSRPAQNHSWMNHYYPRAEKKEAVGYRNNYWRYGPPNTSPGFWSLPAGWPEYTPLYISPVLAKLLKGTFGFLPQRKQTIAKLAVREVTSSWYDSDILQKPCLIAIMALIIDSRSVLPYYSNGSKIQETPIYSEKVESTTLALYEGQETRWLPKICNVASALKQMWQYCKFNIHFMTPNLINSDGISCDRDCNNITVDIVLGNDYGINKTMSVTITHVNSFFKDLDNSKCLLGQASGANIRAIDNMPVKCYDYSRDVEVVTYIKSKFCHIPKKSKDRLRRRSYMKVYKKCTSASSIGEAKWKTPLSKIANIEDFTHALGAAKTLSCVLDGFTGQKILKCLREMKPWINEITPRQALLVLLLANKKETTNVLRCQSVLLQGIAVNRITRAVELDMEIEVIERENVQLAECEGIDYVSATLANRDSLYEELSWIAKTTASDFNKPFDESSEMLLKSLLGKRKKLSPSYLRVMARYVGLGLLKAQNKNDV